MKKTFVKKGQLVLVNGGYLTTGKEETPVFNEDFFLAQKAAQWVVTFAAKAKGKDFNGKMPDSIEDVRNEVEDILSKSDTQYVKMPKAVKLELHDKLQAEALAFIKHDDEVSKTEKINAFLQQFNVIQEFEDFGLYFEEDICKLSNIYTIKEIVDAVTLVVDIIE